MRRHDNIYYFYAFVRHDDLVEAPTDEARVISCVYTAGVVTVFTASCASEDHDKDIPTYNIFSSTSLSFSPLQYCCSWSIVRDDFFSLS